MSTFKQATQLKIRFHTNLGQLSTEQLWDLSLTQLDALAVSLESSYEQSDRKSFLAKKTAKDTITKLKFDIVLEILETKQAIAEEATQLKERNEHNEKILSLIANKQDEEMSQKSVEELTKLLKK